MGRASFEADGLTDDDVHLVRTFADSLRAARRKGAAPRKSFARLWDAWRRAAPPIGKREVERIVAAAVAEVRGRQ